jgi:hypothetical protein
MKVQSNNPAHYHIAVQPNPPRDVRFKKANHVAVIVKPPEIDLSAQNPGVRRFALQ